MFNCLPRVHLHKSQNKKQTDDPTSFFFFFFFFFLIILFIFLIQDSLQADLEFKLQSIASYRKTDYKSIWKKKKKKKKKETTGCKIINRTYKYQKYSVIARYLKVTICP